jgi:hypothetical protein
MSGRTWTLTDDGERIPPNPGDPVCDQYDPAGPGAGIEADGQPQCAGCGWQRSQHKACTEYDGYPSDPKLEDGHPACASCGLTRSAHSKRAQRAGGAV